MLFVRFIPVVAIILVDQVFGTLAFSNNRSDNLAVYWGQDSHGSQQRLSFYCEDDTIDIIPLAFLHTFFGKGGAPVMELANICNQWDHRTFPGTDLVDCSFMASDIQFCQDKGKIVTLSLGGGAAKVGFQSESQAIRFAEKIWSMFLGGDGDIRPFGDAILDGVDLDIEQGSPDHYAAFVNHIRSLAAEHKKKVKTSKTFYVTAAPQCPFPDEKLGNVLNNAHFDAVYVQFYNNYCGLSTPSEMNFAQWDRWARTVSPNPNVRVFIGAPGSPGAAGTGYVDREVLGAVARQAQKSFSTFSGVMLWDADQSHSNGRYDLAIKNAIRQPNPTPNTHSASEISQTRTNSEALRPSPTRKTKGFRKENMQL